ncbi:hypothetical protein K9N68_29355 [Kovacikia minuta CCNUW1]|uniref:hypothetical protein n=1 Tax=Kovacikia minuta TaxID=2931930 RepID=UPI001CCFA533|nr:hypothetical protein [Kovacikia minuta]UBF25628.1 hypothetical protein K9N68_29355 [Kovacikia minuta CCNUW1]
MKLVEMIQEVLQTGVLPMRTERQMQRLLASCPMDEQSIAAIDQLIDALCQGTIQSVA